MRILCLSLSPTLLSVCADQPFSVLVELSVTLVGGAFNVSAFVQMSIIMNFEWTSNNDKVRLIVRQFRIFVDFVFQKITSLSAVFSFLHLSVVILNYTAVRERLDNLYFRNNYFFLKKYYYDVPLIQNGDFSLYLGGANIVNEVYNLPWYPWTYVFIGSTTTILQIAFIIYKKIQSTKIDPKNTKGRFLN